MRYRRGMVPSVPAAHDPFAKGLVAQGVAPGDGDSPVAALGRMVGVLGEDAMFVFASGARDPKDALDGLLQRRSAAYGAAVRGQPHTRMTTRFDAWVIEMARAMAPVSPASWIPMMEVVREKVTLEIGARGFRSLFSNKPSDKDVTRVKRYGGLAVRTLRAVLASDASLDYEERMLIAALIASLGLPEADASGLQTEAPVSPETLEVYGELDASVARAVVRGAWFGAVQNAIDPRAEQIIRVVAQKVGVSDEDLEAMRREAQDRVEARRKLGNAAVDGVRFVLSDRTPGLGVQLAAHVGALTLPRRWRDEALAPVGVGAPVTLAKRHAGLDAEARFAVLGIAWAAALVDDPTAARRALLRTRWERFAADVGEDDQSPRELAERWAAEALTSVARTLG
jgi:hypothetical protein